MYDWYNYNAFGTNKHFSETSMPSSTQAWGYCDQLYDFETGKYYMRARYYNPEIGRFISEDTHWNPLNMIYGDKSYKEGETRYPDITASLQAANLYGYCENNPVNRSDCFGRNWVYDKLKALGKFFVDGKIQEQKIKQRVFWNIGSDLILKSYYGYETSAWLLEHSLQDNPSNVYRGNDSRIASLIKEDSAFLSELNSVMAKYATGSSFKTEGIIVDFEQGDLYYSIHSATIYFSGKREKDNSWTIFCHLYDKYDYTKVTTMMSKDNKFALKASLGTLANDAAVISQKIGAINTYDINVDFTMRWTA